MNNQEQKLTWVNVINFLQKQYTSQSLKEKQWKLQKQVLNNKILNLQSELRSNLISCQDLVKRIKILEQALKEQKQNKQQGHNIHANENQINSIIQKYNLKKEVQKNNDEEFLKGIIKDLKLQDKYIPRIIQNKHKIDEINIQNKTLKQIKAFGAHLDVVTSIAFMKNQQSFFATCSQDCIIKIWDLHSSLKEQIPEPKYILRKHTGPILSIAGDRNPYNRNQSLIFSGGIQGDIKSWRLDKNTNNFNGNWANGADEDQTIWQRKTYAEIIELQFRWSSSPVQNIEQRLKYLAFSYQRFQIKTMQIFYQSVNHTAIKWISNEYFITGCSSAPRITLWNVQGSVKQKFLYEIQKGRQPQFMQVNKLQINKANKCIIGGCQDGYLRIFDYDSSKIIKKLKSNGAITSILYQNNLIISGNHKGCLQLWDSRTFKTLQTIQSCHLQKYQTGITSITNINNNIITSGADGIIKIFK